MKVSSIQCGVGAPPTREKKRGRGAHATGGVLIALWCMLGMLGADRAIPTSTSPVHFRSVDIFVDPHGQKLAAYQLEFTGESDQVKLVGIEGGEHPAFKEPPYYDPKALAHNRAILAALNAGDDLPSTKTRVARLHLEIVGDQPDLGAKLVVAAAPDGAHIPADVNVSEGAKP